MFIDYVKAIAAKKLRVDEMFLGERLDMQEVMQRQGMEGVLGVMVLSPVQMQTLQNFSVTIMDYSLGNGKVGFEGGPFLSSHDPTSTPDTVMQNTPTKASKFVLHWWCKHNRSEFDR